VDPVYYITYIVKCFVGVSSEVQSRKSRLRTSGNRRTDHATLIYPQKSVGIVRLQTKATELVIMAC
jgi:hypothetical protein